MDFVCDVLVGNAVFEDFWATVCKTVCPVLSDRCLSVLFVLSVCNVRALWPNGWTDQDETWQAGRPRPRPHCVRWGPSSPSPKGTQPPQFSAHICCVQMAAWIKMSLGMEIGLGPGDFVLDGDLAAPPLQKRGRSPPQFWPMSVANGWIDQDGTWHGDEPRSRPHCARYGPSCPPEKGGRAPNFRSTSIVAKWLYV